MVWAWMIRYTQKKYSGINATKTMTLWEGRGRKCGNAKGNSTTSNNYHWGSARITLNEGEDWGIKSDRALVEKDSKKERVWTGRNKGTKVGPIRRDVRCLSV